MNMQITYKHPEPVIINYTKILFLPNGDDSCSSWICFKDEDEKKEIWVLLKTFTKDNFMKK